MKIKAIVLTLLTLPVLFFNGCGTTYVAVKCQTPKPFKTADVNCSSIENNVSFMKCATEKYISLGGDYLSLEKAFESCK